MFNNFYSEKQVSEVLGISPYKVRQIGMPSKQVGGNKVRVYSKEEVEAQLSTSEQVTRFKALNYENRGLDGVKMDDYLTINEVLGLIPVSRELIRQNVVNNRIRRLKVWGMYWYENDSLNQWKNEPLRKIRLAQV